MYTATKVAVLALALVAAGAVIGQAQNNATVNVTAAVQQPVVVLKTNDLDFGLVFPGVNKQITLGSASAGRFSVTGQASAGVNLSFAVPANLTSGANLLPVTWDGSWNTVNAAGGTPFTPSAVLTPATLSGTGALFVFVGGTVAPVVSQVAGSYTGTVTMTVTY
jgi:spore coat protein U-like protein